MPDQEDQNHSQADSDAAMAQPADDALKRNATAPADGAGGRATGEPPLEGTEASAAGKQMPQSGGSQGAADGPVPAVGIAPSDIDTALSDSADAAAAVETATEDAQGGAVGQRFDEIAAGMAAEIEKAAKSGPAEKPRPSPSTANLSGASSLELDAFQESPAAADAMSQGIGLLSDVELQVKIELGRTRKTVEEVLALSTGSVVELDRLAGDPVDILVNERLVARGEVLVLNDNLCIRVNEIVSRQVG
jgi:flagellar motor switch protein FliN/FliY